MTTAKSNTPLPSAPRGRGLDALFEDRRAPEASSAAVDADLAALLDTEVRAASGQPAFSDSRSTISAPPPERVVTPAPPIDVPPAAAEARPSETEQPAPSATEVRVSPPPTVVEPARPLPVTKRFGAIIMEAAPAEGPVIEPAAAPTIEETTVGPAGELVSAEGAALAPRATADLRRTTPAGPGAEPEPAPLPAPVERSDDQKTIILSRLNKVLDKDWQRALHGQIDDLYKQVAAEFNSPPANAERALTLLREARQILVETPEEYVAAEYRTAQVKAMLLRTRASRQHSAYYGPRLLGYEGGWLLAFLLGLIFAGPFASGLGRLGGMTEATVAQLFPLWNTMMWGGIGGVVGALYHLWWHISDRQDFDREYFMWYLVQPIMGLVLGGIVFLLLAGGLLILQVNLTDTQNTNTARQLLPYLLAVLSGFRQNFVYEQFDRVIALFTPASRKETEGRKEEGGG